MRKYSLARYKGICAVCGRDILPGMKVVFTKVRGIEHENCTNIFKTLEHARHDANKLRRQAKQQRALGPKAKARTIKHQSEK